jgi:hypothetical protein
VSTVLDALVMPAGRAETSRIILVKPISHPPTSLLSITFDCRSRFLVLTFLALPANKVHRVIAGALCPGG